MDYRNLLLATTGVTIANAAICGYVCHQASRYFEIFHGDSRLLRFCVAATVSTYFLSVGLGAVLVTYRFGDIIMGSHDQLPDGVGVCHFVAGALNQLIVQSFYSYRIYLISPTQQKIAAVAFLLTIADAVISFLYCVLCNTKFTPSAPEMQGLVQTGCALSVALDVYIFATLCYVARSTCQGDQAKGTRLIKRITKLAISTNGLSTATAIAMLAASLAKSPATAVIVLLFPAAYSISLLVNVTSRQQGINFADAVFSTTETEKS